MSFRKFNDILDQTADRMLFKDRTNEEDVVLLIMRGTMMWAVVGQIGDEDEGGIRNVIVKILSVPPLELSLELTNEQLDGVKPFTIENNEAYMKAVDFRKSYSLNKMEELYTKKFDKKVEEEDDSDDKLVIGGNKTVN